LAIERAHERPNDAPDALVFLRRPEVQRVLERAAAAAGAPLSLHTVDRNREGPPIASWGGCAACAHVNDLNEGRKACRRSRTAAATMALRQQRPMPFVCHMGFACVSTPLLPEGNVVATLGPYCPAEESRSLAHDVQRGLAEIVDGEEASLPFELDDIHRAPADAVPAVAAWLRETIRTLWDRIHIDADPDPADLPEDATALPEARPDPSSHGAIAAIALSLRGGSQPRARRLLEAYLDETWQRGGGRPPVQRATTAATVAAVLAALERSGVDSGPGWVAYAALIDRLPALRGRKALVDAALRCLAPAKRAAVKDAGDLGYPALQGILEDRLYEGIPLAEAAVALGMTPSALSHRLRRNFDMTYSEYLGALRVNRAKALLRETQLGAVEIGRRVGIADPSNFGRLFKKHTGTTPLAYRRAHGKNVPRSSE